MRLQVLGRRLHYWISILVALPVAVIAATGLLLQLKKQLPWVQPHEQRGTATVPELSFERILEICRSVPEARIQSWDDIQRLDVRPERGMLKVWAKSRWEIQLDAATGRVLQVEYRRSDTIEAIHDGSWFHPLVKLLWFTPTAALLLTLAVSGMYLFWLPIVVKSRRAGSGEGVLRRPRPDARN